MNILVLLKSFFQLLLSQIKSKKDYVFYSESLFYKNYYIDLLNKVSEKNHSTSILTSDLNEYEDLKKNNFDAYYIGSGFFRILIFNIISCEYFIMTMTDIGNNFKKSAFCKYYVYFFHCMHSTHKMYTEKAFDNYDIILTIGKFQSLEINKNEIINNLPKKKIYETGYFYLDFLENNCNKDLVKKNYVLFAPSWNYDENNLFNNHGHIIIENLIKNNFFVIFRPHPEIIKRNKKRFNQIINIFKNNDNFIIDNKSSNIESMEKASILITDNSSIAIEYSFVFCRPVVFIDYKDKIHNKNFHQIQKITFESEFRSKIGISITNNQIQNLGKICSEAILVSMSNNDKIQNIKKKYLSNVSNSVNVASKILLEKNFNY